ncbi:MAG: molybdenum cofactor biosynthesis protein MoaE [Deltaproteobacteria bacterium]|nr:molybdenum cofactor biosynthesis protein MoaE [Deltaproteobacteria bacterium]MBW1925146.1 molybdenum cofactor biosynthesis protein MoaE [Deltaproteobacteria bacterium]MBW1951143.1 molybdenum cofactor biosynthesis protein MoaE [Deltaproteobacteria bacterium]MBW2009984.1 molybdenum cofactor biosynthesis protein MoaE [Deltaproteobacteria bacterium]
MDLNKMIETVKAHPDYPRMGMIASHLGVVRRNSLKGGEVREVVVDFDHDKISKIINDIKEKEGIFEVIIDVREGRLEVGREIMAVVVGGDIRDRVFPALVDTVDRIKREAVRKQEVFCEP